VAIQHLFGLLVAGSRFSFLSSVLLLILAACETSTSGDPSETLKQSLAEFVHHAEIADREACLKSDVWSSSRAHEVFGELSDSNVTRANVCECAVQRWYGDLTFDERIQLVEDYNRHGNETKKHEPWKSRSAKVMTQCTFIELTHAHCSKRFQQHTMDQELRDLVKQSNVTMDEFCQCWAETNFGNITVETNIDRLLKSEDMDADLTSQCMVTLAIQKEKISKLSDFYRNACIEEFPHGSELLNGMTMEEMCKCQFQGFFGNLTRYERVQLLRDVRTYPDEFLEREPWISLFKDVTAQCVAPKQPT
jgi:hypothetical protein